jgi:hypothetical protein
MNDKSKTDCHAPLPPRLIAKPRGAGVQMNRRYQETGFKSATSVNP